MATMAKPKYGIDMTEGSLLKKMVAFSIPLIITNILQLFYNAADMVVVGQFAGPEALSAVGSTGALVNLIINCFMGLSVGAGVTVSRYFGAKDQENIDKTVQTAIGTAVIASIFAAGLGFILSRPLLELMQTPEDVIDGASLYMRIFFLGMPFNLVYNFGAAMMRAVGDTKRPLKYLAISGVVNVLLNLFFVIVLKISVAGVALATISAQALSSFLVIKSFLKGDGILTLKIKGIKLDNKILKNIIKIGLPAGVQGSLFSLSNVIVQSAVNSFGSVVVAGNVAGANLGGFLYTAMACVNQAAMTSAGQNMGAKKYKRVKSGLYYALLTIVLIGVVLGAFFYILSPILVSFYNSDPAVVEVGVMRLRFLSVFYIFCGFMDVISGQLRGMGASLLPTIISLLGVCVLRIVWISVVFSNVGTLMSIYISYPISWAVTAFVQYIAYLILSKKLPNE